MVTKNIAANTAAMAVTRGQFGPRWRLAGRTKPLAAVVLTVSVAVPVSDEGLNVIVCGAVKLTAGAPKLHDGRSTAFAGEELTPQVKVTAPLNAFAPTTVIKQEPDCPALEIMIVALQPVVTLRPEEPTVTVICEEVLAE